MSTNNSSREIIIHDDNPFKDEIRKWQNISRTSTKSMEGNIRKEKVTITMEREYIPIPFVMLYQHKEKLQDLSPAACKLLIYIALNMSYGDQKVFLERNNIGMHRDTTGKAIMELTLAGILRKEKQGWYWVNITILIMGTTKKIGE